MAKSLLQMKSKKKVQKTRSEIFIVNRKYMGDEPTQKEVRENELRSINWFSTMCDRSDSRDFAKAYFEATGRKELAKKAARISDTWWPMYAGWTARLLMIDPEHPSAPSWKEHFERSIQNAMVHIVVEKEDAAKKSDKPSIQDRVKDRVSDIIGDVEAILDGDEKIDMYAYLQKVEMPPAHALKIAAYYKPYLEELALGVYGDKEVLEGYKNYTKAQLKARMEYVAKLIDDCERYSGVAKKTRAVRKPRAVSVDKVIKNLKFQKENKDYKLASIPPSKIIGAQELWTFNAKYGTLTHFVALDRGGLSIKGSSIIKFDEGLSKSYKTGRQTAKIVDEVAKAGKLNLKKIISTLKDNPFNARCNENTILLRII
jgi:hypothetical protein